MPVAKAMDKLKVMCTIFMDDICLQVPTRWKLRRAIKKLNAVFNTLKIEKHPDKTEMGRVERGFDFLGYHYSSDGLSVACVTLERFNVKAAQLYEQTRSLPAGQRYLRRFLVWLLSGIRGVSLTEAWKGELKKLLSSLTAAGHGLNGPAYALQMHG